ncbi:MAG TPA: universal stress protein [Burkholderiaceae bacterium]|nr:universal stress protein [Burkholderiaceae bacterium]
MIVKTLVVPVDGSALTERAMGESIELARQLGAAIVGFVVEPDMPLPGMGTNLTQYGVEADAHQMRTDTHAHELLTRFGAQAAAAGVPFSTRHERTDRVDAAIARVAEEFDDAMIVMVTHGRGVFGELLFGSHTKNVMALTKKPLLVLH